MEQIELFAGNINEDDGKIKIGHNLFLGFSGMGLNTVKLYHYEIILTSADFSDQAAKRIFIVEAVERGAVKTQLAEALKISRQTIHNYIETKKYFGLEGLIHNYNSLKSKSLKKQRELHADKRLQGNKAEQLADIRQTAKKEHESKQLQFDFEFSNSSLKVEEKDQPFAEEHNWEASRYAGVFLYLITLFSQWRWSYLVMGLYGISHKIFMVFLLMAARDIRSIEQLKNVRLREAGLILGIKRIASKTKVWQWFYSASEKRISVKLLGEFFRYQVRAGLVGTWLWFTDGHLLPYTGKEKVRCSYNTQRRMPYPGRTNIVTCDSSGRVVNFEIQEGKGNLKNRIVKLGEEWQEELPDGSVMIFDREGNGKDFFWALINKKIPFVTWEKNIDSKKLAELNGELFNENLELNGKKYSFFEEDKPYQLDSQNSKEEKISFTLRRIYIWNRSSNRRVCGLAWSGQKELSTEDCVHAILSRWGASENMFKHINARHPLHYHPGFKLEKSEKQDIANPEIKEKITLIGSVKKNLAKVYKKITRAKAVLNKDGSTRKNSVLKRLQEKVSTEEMKLKKLHEEKKALPERVDASSLEDYQSIKKIDNEGKNLFDFVTCSVWNARKQMVDWLRPQCGNNDNELVDLFYTITQCHGWIKSTKNQVVVRLEPLEQPKRRTAQEFLCRKLTSLGARSPNGKGLIVEVGESPL